MTRCAETLKSITTAGLPVETGNKFTTSLVCRYARPCWAEICATDLDGDSDPVAQLGSDAVLVLMTVAWMHGMAWRNHDGSDSERWGVLRSFRDGAKSTGPSQLGSRAGELANPTSHTLDE